MKISIPIKKPQMEIKMMYFTEVLLLPNGKNKVLRSWGKRVGEQEAKKVDVISFKKGKEVEL